MRFRTIVPIAAVAVVAVFFFSSRLASLVSGDSTPVVTADYEQPTDNFGVPEGEFGIIDERIRYGQVFSDMLTPYGVSYENTVLLASAVKEVFDVRKLKADNNYRIYLDDSLGTAKYLVYEQDKTSFVVFDIDGMSARIDEKPVTTEIRTVAGKIHDSLFMSLLDQGVHPMVAVRMNDVYAWQIDFYRIQPGDSYRIIYEDRYAGDERIDPGNILSARFNHAGKDYYAIHFEQGDIDDYYDEKGESIRGSFLMAPVNFSRISSSYSLRRFHPVQKRYKAHLGTDYVAPAGTPIVSTGDGVVTEARFGQFNGNYVKIKHNNVYTTQYLHMSKIESGIRPGVRVKQNQRIGYVGHTGLATGDHVCYRFWKDGSQVDHRKEKFPSIGPVPEAYRADYIEMRDRYIAQLSAPINIPIDPTYAMLLKDPGSLVSP